MAAITTAVVAGVGMAMSAYGSAAQGDAALAAGEINAQNSEYNANLAKAKAAEDEKRFREAYRRENANNVVAIGASGVKMEGSPLEVLQNNAANMEADATNIRLHGMNEADSYKRQASYARFSARAGSQAAGMSSAANVLTGASSAASSYNRTSGGKQGS